MIVLDTDVCIELLRGNRRVIEHRRSTTQVVAVSFVTAGELYYGAARSPRPTHNHRLVDVLLASVRIAHSSVPVMQRFGLEKGRLMSSGQTLPDADILIAATCLCARADLATGNTEHFRRFDGLGLLDWLR